MPRTLLTLAVAGVMAIALASCGDDNGSGTRDGDIAAGGSPEPNQTIGAGYQPFPDQRNEKVTIYDDRVEPPILMAESGVPAQFTIENKSASECIFYVGDFLQGTRVAPGATERMSTTFPVNPGAQGASTSPTVKMGCQNDSKRQGNVEIQFTGVRPNQGGNQGPGNLPTRP